MKGGAETGPAGAIQHDSGPLLRGILLIVAAEFSFALATVFVKIITSTSSVPAIELSFFRFAAGFTVMLIYVLARGKSLVPRNITYVSMRAFFNTAAVIFFFMGVQYSTVTKVNILNMTYPIFVFMLAPLINREKTDRSYYLYLALSLCGVYLVVIPGGCLLLGSGVNRGDLLALASGITAGFAITSLRQARKYDDAYLILFYLMGFGAAANLLLAAPFFVLPGNHRAPGRRHRSFLSHRPVVHHRGLPIHQCGRRVTGFDQQNHFRRDHGRGHSFRGYNFANYGRGPSDSAVPDGNRRIRKNSAVAENKKNHRTVNPPGGHSRPCGRTCLCK
jgi:drug/metabolite transporter (DMT)-like permease